MPARSTICATLLLIGSVAVPVADAAETAVIEGVRVWDHGGHTRVVVDLSEATDYVAAEAPQDAGIQIGFPHVTWRADATGALGLISSSAFDPAGMGGHLSLKTAGNVKIKRSFTLTPDSYGGHRIVLDIVRKAPPVEPVAIRSNAVEPITESVPKQSAMAALRSSLGDPSGPIEIAQTNDIRILGNDAGQGLGEGTGSTVSERVLPDQAVADFNVKADAFVGSIEEEFGRGMAGSFAFPILRSVGGQIDFLRSERDETSLNGLGGQIFWRDPTQGLVGFAGHRMSIGDAEFERFGVETEAYLGRVTLGAALAMQTGDLGETFYADVGARMYLSDGFAVGAEVSAFDVYQMLSVDAEWQPETTRKLGISTFGQAAVGTEGQGYVFAGLRWYWGGDDVSLSDRHRYYDPVNPLVGSTMSAAAAVIGAADEENVPRCNSQQTLDPVLKICI